MATRLDDDRHVITIRVDDDLLGRLEALRESQPFRPPMAVVVRAALIKMLDEWEAKQ